MTTEHHATALPDTMLAVQIREFGDTGVMRVERVALPAAGPEQVLVMVVAAGVGPWDGWIRSGNSVLPQPLPLTLGSDISGIVVAVGAHVDGFAVGDAVYGVTNQRFTGGYAEYAACLAAMVAHKPASLSHLQAASAPVIAVTAWQMLFDSAGLRAGQRVLIHGAGGNVGRYAVQLARAAGLEVVASGRERDREALLALGANRIVGGGLTPVEQVDAVIDLVGGESQIKLFDFLPAGGALVSAVSEPDKDIAAARAIKAGFMLVNVNTATLDQLARRFDQGELATWCGAVLPLAQAAQAHLMMARALPAAAGKIVLQVA